MRSSHISRLTQRGVQYGSRAARNAALLSLFLGYFVGAASGQQVSLSIGSGSTNAGGKITLNLTLNNSGGSLPTSVEWTMTYPASDIAGITTAAGTAASAASKTVSCNSISGSTTCAVFGLNTDPIPSGNLAAVTFQLANSPVDSTIGIQVVNPISSLATGEAVATTSTGGSVSVANAVPALSGFSCWPASFSGPGSSTCSLGLTGAAPAGGLAATISSNKSSIKVPSSVTVPQGSSSASFVASVSAVRTTQYALVTAQMGSVTKTSQFSLAKPAEAPILLSSVACSPTSLSSGASASCSVTLTAATPASIPVSIESNNVLLAVPSSITIPQNQNTAPFTAVARVTNTPQSVLITAVGPNNSQETTVTLAAAVPAVSIWSSSAVPGTISDPDSNSVEIGVKFRSGIAGSVTGVKFYKGSQNTGAHAGHLWTATGQLLASVNFVKETATGWQTAMFSAPVAIQPNTTYIVSYYTSVGHYSSDEGYFNSAVINGPLQALQDGVDGGNGVYSYGYGGFPNQSWNASNYWVDVVLNTSASQNKKTFGQRSEAEGWETK